MVKKGRPESNINVGQFEELCAIQCTIKEIAAVLSVSESTVRRWCKKTYGKTFDEIAEEKRQAGLVSLRRMQHMVAMDGSVPMLVWLGKNYLNQTDKKQVDIPAVPLTFVDDL